MKTALLAASLVLVGGAAVGCSGGSDAGAPTDATEDDYCQGYRSLFEDLTTMTERSDKQVIAQVKDWATTMEETGTPEGIPADARAGFETTVRLIGDLGPDATRKDFETMDQDLSEEQSREVEAFSTYTVDLCGSPLDDMENPEMPSETPAETPAETPPVTPSETPSQ